jgi:hypothetical protein
MSVPTAIFDCAQARWIADRVQAPRVGHRKTVTVMRSFFKNIGQDLRSRTGYVHFQCHFRGSIHAGPRPSSRLNSDANKRSLLILTVS